MEKIFPGKARFLGLQSEISVEIFVGTKQFRQFSQIIGNIMLLPR